VGLDNTGVPADEFVGTIGRGFFLVDGAVPEWKSNLHLSYEWRDLTVGAGWRYIDGMTDADLELSPVFKVPSMDYFDLNVSYEFSSGILQGLRLGTGVENLTDEDPPTFPSWLQAQTDPSQYDVFGRRYFMTLTYAF
jgi:outer membrane receptor protein involved in Fe transport